ncbi:MAG: branched-chain amino acid ABC transporter permease [Sphaerochaetaceae bacterium]
MVYLIIVPLAFRNNNYLLNVIITSSILSIISLGVWLVFAIGRINIGQGAFALIGGYTSAILLTKTGISFWLALPLSGILAGLIGYLIGRPILRLKGVYFDMLTLCMTQFATLAMLNMTKLTSGARGIINIPLPKALKIAGITVIPQFTPGNYIPFYYLTALILIFTFFALVRLNNSRVGRVFSSLRQHEGLTASIGIDVVKYRLLAYTICCFLGGLGGSLFVVYTQSIFPTTFKVADSVNFMLYCFFGGLEYLFGPILGSFLLTISFEYLRVIQKYQEAIYAVLLILMMLFLPNGLLSIRIGQLHDKTKLFISKNKKKVEM